MKAQGITAARLHLVRHLENLKVSRLVQDRKHTDTASYVSFFFEEATWKLCYFYLPALQWYVSISSFILVKDSMVISAKGIFRPGIFAMMAFSLIGVILRYSGASPIYLWLILGIELVIVAWTLVRYFLFRA